MKNTLDPGEFPPLSARERRIAELYLGEEASAGEMARLTAGLDLDNSGQMELLLLACIGYRQGWEGFPKEAVPRLKGLHQYYQVHNTIRVPWLLGKVRALRTAGIPVLLLKGLAMRFYYAPGVPRMMWDYDIAVPEASYDEAIRLLQADGDRYLGNAPWMYHGQIMGKGRCLEVHSWIFKHHGERGSDIWERALPCDFFGEDVLVPCPEDMLLHQLDNRCRDMFEVTFPGRTPGFVCDCCRIAERLPCLDIPGLAARARELHVTNSARRMLLFLAQSMPELFPEAEIKRAFPETPEYRQWLEAGEKLRRATLRWRSYGYLPGGAMTPRRFLRTVARHRAIAALRSAEMQEMGESYSFWTYCADLCRAGAVQTLLGRFGFTRDHSGEAADERKSK